MKRVTSLIAAAAIALACSACMSTADTKMERAPIDQMLAAWPETSAKAARMMVDKYGMPNEWTPSMLIWTNNGPWKRTMISREETQHDFPMPHKDVMEQVIDYRVPWDKFDELAAYDGSVMAERTKGELSARCDKEEANLLALNLANDVVTGKRAVEEARRFYAETIKGMMEGRMSPYVERFQFDVRHGGTMDPDRPIMPMR